MENFVKSGELYNLFDFGIELKPEFKETFVKMVNNVLKHPFSRYFSQELTLFKGYKMTSIVGLDERTLKSVNYMENLIGDNNSVSNIKGLVVTYSKLDEEANQKLNYQLCSLPESINCIIYGGVTLTSESNQVEFFVFQQYIDEL